MRRLFRNKNGEANFIGAAIGLFIGLIVCVLIFYNLYASLTEAIPTPATGSSTYQWALFNSSRNASSGVADQAATFFTIAPIIGIVIVAVVVISYIQRIGG